MSKESINEKIDLLNKWTKAYDEGHPLVSDEKWDEVYFKLVQEERAEQYYREDSPTQKVVYQVKNKLQKSTHDHLMLSLDKTKDDKEIEEFINSIKSNYCIAMTKVDGLTCSLTYINGRLTKAETRGDGKVGEDITHNALVVSNIPNRINTQLAKVVIDGEIICDTETFKEFESEYKNPRNFAAGSIRLLDSAECKKRKLSFIVWDVIEGGELDFLSDKLNWAAFLGFSVVPHLSCCYGDKVESIKEWLNREAQERHIPYDGLVFKYDKVDEYESLGRTDHHFKGGLAYKFYDELYETTLEDIEWSMGRTGKLTPVAIFKEVNIDGTTVSRASLSNLSIMEKTLGLEPYEGQIIYVSKRNQINPKIEKAKDVDGNWIE